MADIPDLKVLYEDDDTVVILKPAGLIVHPDGKTKEPAVTDWFLARYPHAAEVGEPITQTNGITISRPGIVHRLDRETSGALILAKTAASHAWLKEQFATRTVRKKYLAFVHGFLEDVYGVIQLPIGRSSKDFRQWTAGRGVKGETRDAMTWYTVLERTKTASLIAAEPKTGRTHQIRVHMDAIHHPVIGDALYAPTRPSLFGFTRTALHAYLISWPKPNGEYVTVRSPLPADFIGAFEAMGVSAKVRKAIDDLTLE
jgi:23S rRNA pseudouridine1911/1915/1917 synthase